MEIEATFDDDDALLPRPNRERPFVTWFAALALVVAAFVLSGCSPLTAYNSLAPADQGADLAASDVAYGEAPRHKLDVYRPNTQAGSYPVAVVFYGGSWNSGRKQDYAFLGRALASRGIVAVIADYRLVPEVHFPAFLDDGARAVAWAHANTAKFGGDPNRLFLVGHSAGAYNAAMIALDGRYLATRGLNRSIIKGVAGLAGPYDFLPLDTAVTRATFGQAPNLTATQPITFVSSDAPPMLLATGSDDTTVKPRNTNSLAEKLRRAGVDVTVRTYPGIGHVGILMAMSMPFRSRAPVLDDVATFILGQSHNQL